MEKESLTKTKKFFNTMMFVSHIIIFAIFYFLLPRLLSFPKYFDNIGFQIETIKIPLIVYFIVVCLISYIFESLVQKMLMRRINKYVKKDYKPEDKRFIIETRNDCMNLSYKFIKIQFFIIAIVTIIAVVYFVSFGKLFITNFEKIQVSLIRLGLIILAIWLLLSVSKYYLLQLYSNEVLKHTYENNYFYKKNDNTISNMLSILIQIIPLIITIFVVFISFSYSNTIDVSSKAISTYYKVYIDSLEINKEEISSTYLMSLVKKEIPLWEEDNVIFVIDYDNNIVTSTGEEISEFMKKYKDKYFFFYTDENGKDCISLTQASNVIYESYGIDEHAFVKCLKDEYGRSYFVGIKYFAGNLDSFNFLVKISVIMFIIYAFIFVYWAKSNSINMKKVEENMKKILSEKDILQKNFMPILSNDEIGNISYYYNKIQDKLLTQRDIMFKQEQLSVLGELAGGMAHDINTPISSINTSILMLEKYSTSEKENEILENMKISSDRIINIVNSMRNQIRNLGSNDKEKFSLNAMVEDLHVLTQNEQKKNGCTFESEVKDNIEVYGERTKLGQVLTNLVVNGIQAYGQNNKKGNVKLVAFKKGSNTCRIEIEDQAGGIPKKVQKFIFKNIMTTKGVKGTGLGLYLASSVITGIYQGEIWFEVKEGIGTKFIIEIPMKMEE